MTSEQQDLYDEIYGLDGKKPIVPHRVDLPCVKPVRNTTKSLSQVGSRNHTWNGGRFISSAGYVRVMVPNHPRANIWGYAFEHMLVVERAIGRFLMAGEIVHHLNEDKTDNRPSNLVLTDNGFHRTLHRRTNALKACGNPEWIRCPLCKVYDSPENLRLSIRANGFPSEGRHRKCDAEYRILKSGAWTPEYQYKPNK